MSLKWKTQLGIAEAIVRGANIAGGSKVKRIIIIPEERLGLLLRKVQEPALEERIRTDKWKFIWYDDVKEYCDEYKRKDKLTSEQIHELYELAKPLPLKEAHQAKLKDFIPEEEELSTSSRFVA
jgi:hypothetical protein